jgi:stage II sporulation protein AA (anti-sigma F factor antagonist)
MLIEVVLFDCKIIEHPIRIKKREKGVSGEMENFSLERNGANLILHISEELDHHAAAQISKTIDVLIEKGNVKNIVFDFTGMTFMDSSGIGMVMGRYRKIQYFGGSVFVTGVGAGVNRIFSMSGVYKIIQKI